MAGRNKFYTVTSLFINVILLLWGFVIPAAALCDTFTSTDPAYTVLAHSQRLPMWVPTHCPDGGSNNTQFPCHSRHCTEPVVPSHFRKPGKLIPFSVHGFTNASLSGDLTFLYALATEALHAKDNKPADLAGGTAGASARRIEQSMDRCFSAHPLYSWHNSQWFCVEPGRSAYPALTPILQCVDGVVSGCSPDVAGIGHAPELKNGTALQICGPVRRDYGNLPVHQLDTIYVSEPEARRLQSEDIPPLRLGGCRFGKYVASRHGLRHSNAAAKLSADIGSLRVGLLTGLSLLTFGLSALI